MLRGERQMVQTYQTCPVIPQATEKALSVWVRLSSSYGSCSWTTGSISLPRTPQAWTRTPPYLPLRSTTPLQSLPFSWRRILERERDRAVNWILVRERVELKPPRTLFCCKMFLKSIKSNWGWGHALWLHSWLLLRIGGTGGGLVQWGPDPRVGIDLPRG
jgi:hypothetical protein